MAKIQSVERKPSLLFAGDMNTHHEEWLGASTMTMHVRAAFDFESSSGYEQMFTEPTHIDGGVLDLVRTDA